MQNSIEAYIENRDEMVVIDYCAYTLPGEEWRGQAYFELMRMLREYGWCKHLERLEGTLLGYTDEQNDYHIDRTFGQNGCN